MKHEHLHLLIHEEIYRLPEDRKLVKMVEETIPDVEVEKQPTQVAESEPEIVKEPVPKPEESRQKGGEPEPIVVANVESESPKILIQEIEEPEEIPFVVFHDSTDPTDQELLQKIIDACKLPQDQYKVFGAGFDQSVQFRKALVFVPEAKVFYTPVPYKDSEFLCSKPLTDLAKDQNEKAKLWGALQKFL